MTIELQETFQVTAPVEEVWAFMMDPEKVAICLPGATLTEVLDQNSFLGSIKVKIGAIVARYQGKLSYTKRDKDALTTEMLAEAKEKSGGTLNGTISVVLSSLQDGGTEAKCGASVDLTGRIAQVGGGMIEGVSAEMIKKFVANVKMRLETPAGEGEALAPPAEDSINIIAVVFTVIWKSIVNFFKRLFGRA
jgi:carbon monoxide dehydrogenase subunit G